MSNIQKYLQNIMQAVYGKDVRQSIHDAIEMIDSVADTAKDSATASAKMAETMAENAGKYADEAQTCVVAAAASEANAKASETAVKASENAAKTSADNAVASETAVAESKDAAAASEANAKTSEEAAGRSAEVATEKAAAADQSADTAAEKAEIATEKAAEIVGKAEAVAASATKAESYAVGGTGSREGEDTDNAAYYYRQAKSISESFAGALRPMGTVSFVSLPALTAVTAGDMYNISDEFTTTDDFKEGAGSVIPAGANIYKTSDGKWDVLAGVKGAKEAAYRRGNVNLTAADVGAVAEDGDASDVTVTFSTADERTNIATGEKLSALFSKIAKWLSDLKPVAFSGSYDDLSNKPTIPTDTWRPVQDNLTSTSSTDCLSARMGKYLSENKANAEHYHDARYYTKTETDTRMAKAMRYVGLYEQEIVLAAGGEFYQAIPSEYQNGGYIYIINCSGNSLNFTGNMEGYNMAVKNRGAATLATRVQVHFFSIGV